ncbi:MAG: AAA family ATPase [Magnetococcales bacterium]|nr:AAA family ATPase [Magnetococcales bacterium]
MEADTLPTPTASHASDSRSGEVRRSPYFPAKSHASVWRALRSALIQGEGLILLTGPEGIGKSALVRRLPGILPDDRELVLIRSVEIPGEEFLQKLVLATTLRHGIEEGGLAPVEFEPEGQNAQAGQPLHPAMNLKDLLDAMEERSAQGRRLVLAVDHAHLLNEEQLGMLEQMIRFSANGIKPVQVLLVGRPALRHLLTAEEYQSLAGLVVGTCEVTPLTHGEVWDYLEFQLDKALGWPVRVTWLGWMEIHSRTQGIPLRIDIILKRLIMLARQRNAKEINRGLVKLALSMGKPLPRGAFFLPLLRDRAPWLAGSAVVFTGVLYLASGLFFSPHKPSSGEEADRGNTSYVRIAKPEPSKPAGKPQEAKGDGKNSQKRYWEPAPMQGRGEPPPTENPERVTLPPPAEPAPAAAPVRRAGIPDPETFRKRYQNAKAQRASAAPPQEETGKTPAPPPRESPQSRETLALKQVSMRPPPRETATREVEAPPKPAEPVPPAHKPPEPKPVTPARETVEVKPAAPKPPVPKTAATTRETPADKAEAGGTKSPAPPRVATAPKPLAETPLPRVQGVATEKTFRAAGKLYVVQMGSFATQENAEQLRDSLAGEGRELYVHLWEKNKQRWYSVRMNFREYDPANRMAKALEKQSRVPTKVLQLHYE